MAISSIDKMKILKFFSENPLGEIYYSELMSYLGKKAKITDIEFVEFFTNYVIENLKKESISMNMICKMIMSITTFISWLHEDEVDINLELLLKLYSIRDCYEHYLEEFNKEKKDNVEELIVDLENNLNDFYPIDEKKESVDLEAIVEELNTLKDELSKKETEISDLTSRLNKQEKAYESKKNDNNKLSKQLVERNVVKKNLENKVRELEAIIANLNNTIISLNDELANADQRNNLLNDLNNKIENDYGSLKRKFKNFRKKLKDAEKQIEELRNDEEFKILIPRSLDHNQDIDNKIEGLIIQKMLTGQYTLEEIKVYLVENGYSLSNNKIRGYFDSIKDKMTYLYFEESEIDILDAGSREYVISLPDDFSCVDLLVVSDFHLSNFDKDIIGDMELINDYCEENGINTILNAGDFFSWTRLIGKHQGSACQRIVDKVILKYPSRKGIKHAILGGNHDKDMLAAGVDPLQLMAEAREDFINLGYGHCKITFGGSVSILDSIGMHHPNRRFPETVGDSEYSTSKIVNMIKGYNGRNGIDSDNIYVDLLGHIHMSSLDAENGICIIPSYRKDRVVNGAWHLKVYFKDNHINNIVFIPIIKTRKLIPTTEINYQKRLILK